MTSNGRHGASWQAHWSAGKKGCFRGISKQEEKKGVCCETQGPFIKKYGGDSETYNANHGTVLCPRRPENLASSLKTHKMMRF